MDSRLVTAIIVIVAVPATLIGYILVVERGLRFLPERLQPRLRPWLWLLPALALLTLFLVYPTIATAIRSLQDKNIANPQFIGLTNYQYFFSTGDTLVALRNNVIWLVLLTAFVVGGGLLSAILFDRVRYEPVAKSLLFVPLAISFVGAGVIWKFVYAYVPAGAPQIGTLNGLLAGVGSPPHDWTQTPPGNTVALIVVAAWIWTGLRHGHPVGRAQGHQRRAARGGPRSTGPTSSRSSGASRCRCSCRRSRSSRRR